MQVHDLLLTAGHLPQAWRSAIFAQDAGANLKVLRMDAQAYPDEVQTHDEALLMLDGVLHLAVGGATVSVYSDQMVIVPWLPMAWPRAARAPRDGGSALMGR